MRKANKSKETQQNTQKEIDKRISEQMKLDSKEHQQTKQLKK